MTIRDVARVAHLQWQIAGDLRALAEPTVLSPARRRAIARHLDLAGITDDGVTNSGVDCPPRVLAAHRAARLVIAAPPDPDRGERDTITWALGLALVVIDHVEVTLRQESGESFDEARRRMNLRARPQRARLEHRDRPWDGLIGKRR